MTPPAPRRPPDGSAMAVRLAVQRVRGLLSSPVWLFVAVILWPLGLLGLVGLTLTMTRPAHAIALPNAPVWPWLRLSPRRLFRVMLGVTVLAAVVPSPARLVVSGVAAVVTLLALWAHLLQLTRPGSALRQRIGRSGALTGAAGALLWFALMVGPLGRMLMLVAAAGLVVGGARLLGTLRDFWTAPEATPAETLAALRQLRGLEAEPWAEGLRLVGDGEEVRVRLRQAPVLVEVVVAVPGLPPGLVLRGGSGGVPLTDPLLARTIAAEGVEPVVADALLAGHHEVLLPVFHAWPRSTLSGGILTIHMPGPPFPGHPDEVQTPLWIRDFIADRQAEARALRAALSEK